MAVERGNGLLTLNGEQVRYQFDTSINSPSYGYLSNQCQYQTALNNFTEPPVFVAGKDSRANADGGWLRRCDLSATAVSVVVDEDTYRSAERAHGSETYGYMALEPIREVLTCFNDDFNRSDIDNNWLYKVLGSSAAPRLDSGRLRLTNNGYDQAVVLTLQRLFPARNNLVQIEFDHFAYAPFSDTGGDGIAVVLSDATVPPQPGGFGGSLGYAQRDLPFSRGFAGGWLGVGIDEYGNFATNGGGKNGGTSSLRPQSVSLRGSEAANYPFLYVSNSPLSPRIDARPSYTANPGYRYRITIDARAENSAIVGVERRTSPGGSFTPLTAPFNVYDYNGGVPQDFLLSLTGSSGQATNFHEIDNFEVCASRINPIEAQIDHFQFEYAGSPLACAPQQVTIKACLNAACSSLYTGAVSASLLPANGGTSTWLDENQNPIGNQVSINGGSRTLFLREFAQTPTTLGVASSSPGTLPFSDTLCSNGASLNTANCTLSFAEAGFIIDDVETYANKPVDTVIKAVRRSTGALECQPTFGNQTKNLSLWSSDIDPSPSFGSASFTVDGQAIARSQSTALPQAVNFNGSGEATVSLRYSDAGKMALNARFVGAAGGEDDGLVMASVNGNMINVPVGLCIAPEAEYDSGSDSVFKRAGDSYQVALSGRAWLEDGDTDFCDNPVTPSFTMANLSLGSIRVAPASGVDAVISPTVYTQTLGGEMTLSQSLNEVGIYKLTAWQPKSAGVPLATHRYLGSLLPIADGISANVGRFVPAKFRVSDQSLLPACSVGGFSYMDQPMTLGLTLTAENVQNERTYNYVGALAHASAAMAAENGDDGIALSSRLSPLPPLTWNSGQAQLPITTEVTFDRLAAPGVDGPFDDLNVGIMVNDNDGGYASVADANMDANRSGVCSVAPDSCDALLLQSTRVRAGRLMMDNTYGPETERLSMPSRTQYWDGSQWQTNALDNCTVINPSLSSAVDNDSLGYRYFPSLSSGQTVTRSLAGAIHQGEFSLMWQQLGGYRGQVTAPLITPRWLQWYWNWDASSPNQLVNPRASAFFGSYRGNDKVIYWRERND
ncbi:DUF6701 domain-containing protein [Shewanella sp. NIFS-20-20]|uniref:DUF6701 domain-containing protein n=1 Tax=Shewanella sp. NIFS-20-20 TaxID=2853806 RepID=UPI001C4741A8|nr:DUF6701 domain-containing protein [Shewanella sp. NIFS-20-20]MBV7315317.1 MSHA biogenesis protein MshQ [Shewanella sp. NIFS-20-20]